VWVSIHPYKTLALTWRMVYKEAKRMQGSQEKTITKIRGEGRCFVIIVAVK
jgi:hypothetical protein